MRRAILTIAITVLCALGASAAPASEMLPRHRPAAVLHPPLPQEDVSVPEELSAIAPAAGARQADAAGGDAFAGDDANEDAPFPDYPAGARVSIGAMKTYTVGEEDTFVDIARHFDLGYVELRAANPGIDPWMPAPGETVAIPEFKLLPRAPQQGIVVNLGEMRMYYYKEAGKPPLTFPLGIGREGLETPMGQTTVIRKVVGPVWRPTPRMRKEKTWLPAEIPAGPANPLGTHAMYLGFKEVLIHGSNKPWGIGRRVSSGCMRMYPEDIISMYGMTPVGTKVTIVNQPILVGWLDDGLYLEANPSMRQSNEVEVDDLHTVKPLTSAMRKNIEAVAGAAAGSIDWTLAEKAVRERHGVPVRIAPRATGEARVQKEKEKDKAAQLN